MTDEHWTMGKSDTWIEKVESGPNRIGLILYLGAT